MNYLILFLDVWSHSLSTISVILVNMIVFFCFLRSRWKWWIYPLLMAITVCTVPMVYAVSKSMLGASFSSSLFRTFLGYWGIIMVFITFRDRILKIFFVTFTVCIINRMFVFWSYILYIPLNNLTGGTISIDFSAALTVMILYTMILICYWFVLRKKIPMFLLTDLSVYSWAGLASIAVSAKLIIDFCSDYAFALNPYSDDNLIWAMIALCTFVIVVLILFLYSTFVTLQHSELKASADRLLFEKTVQQQYYETQLHNQQEVKRIKHDMNGHLNIIYQLLEQDQKEEALRYLQDFGKYTRLHQKELYSDNPYLNAVLSNYSCIFADNEIPFEFDIQIGNLEFPYIEACLALNNAFQNALEASLKLDASQRFIKLQVKSKNNHLLLRITNHFDQQLCLSNGLPHSTKNTPGHGYGLSSIRDAAESVGGFMDVQSIGDLFILDVTM